MKSEPATCYCSSHLIAEQVAITGPNDQKVSGEIIAIDGVLPPIGQILKQLKAPFEVGAITFKVSMNTTPKKRIGRLGYELKKMRKKRGLTLDRMARELSWSPSKLSKIESCTDSLKGDDEDRLEGYLWAKRYTLPASVRELSRQFIEQS